MKEIRKKLTDLTEDMNKECNEAQEVMRCHGLGASEEIEQSYRLFIQAQASRNELERVKWLLSRASYLLDKLE